MKDLEVELRRVMRDRAAVFTSAPPLPRSLLDPRQTTGRAKGRRRAVIVALAATLVLGAGVALSHVLVDPEPPTVSPVTERLIVASGETAQGPAAHRLSGRAGGPVVDRQRVRVRGPHRVVPRPGRPRGRGRRGPAHTAGERVHLVRRADERDRTYRFGFPDPGVRRRPSPCLWADLIGRREPGRGTRRRAAR
jgi:hypothetical protein